jgi:hypothetical protein
LLGSSPALEIDKKKRRESQEKLRRTRRQKGARIADHNFFFSLQPDII